MRRLEKGKLIRAAGTLFRLPHQRLAESRKVEGLSSALYDFACETKYVLQNDLSTIYVDALDR